MNLNLLLLPPVAIVFFVFLKIGLVFFGGGYVVIPVMHRELVEVLHLMTEQQFIDGMAISQLTPGPIAIMATFSGYCIAGVFGALVGTFAMFLPGSVLMFLISKKYEKIRHSQKVRKMLRCVIPAVVGLLLSTCWKIGHDVILNPLSFCVFILSSVLLIRYKTNPMILIFCTALMGVLLHL